MRCYLCIKCRISYSCRLAVYPRVIGNRIRRQTIVCVINMRAAAATDAPVRCALTPLSRISVFRSPLARECVCAENCTCVCVCVHVTRFESLRATSLHLCGDATAGRPGSEPARSQPYAHLLPRLYIIYIYMNTGKAKPQNVNHPILHI